MRVVLDANVLISALLSSTGAPAQILRAWLEGRFELIVSPLLLAELERAFAYPKLRHRIPAEDAEAFVGWLSRAAEMVAYPDGRPPVRAVDPGDDYLLSLASAEHAVLVSGDDHLLSLEDRLPVLSPARLITMLEE